MKPGLDLFFDWFCGIYSFTQAASFYHSSVTCLEVCVKVKVNAIFLDFRLSIKFLNENLLSVYRQIIRN